MPDKKPGFYAGFFYGLENSQRALSGLEKWVGCPAASRAGSLL